MHMRAAVLPLFVLAALALPFGPRKAALTFEEVTKLAEANAATPEGKAYAEEVSRHFTEQHVNSLRECAQGAKTDEAEKKPFQLALRISKRGKVDEVLARPQTRAALCMMRTAVKDHLSKPPRGGAYWVIVELTPTP